jgi:hypothetical protein
MGDHFVYKDVEGTTTEWDDIQRKLGNLPPKDPPFKAPAWTPAATHHDRKGTDWIDEKTQEELVELEDDSALEDDRFLEEYRSVSSLSPSPSYCQAMFLVHHSTIHCEIRRILEFFAQSRKSSRSWILLL